MACPGNGKNLLAVARDGRWPISAVLDWEFARSGSPLADVGNLLRFREISEALDLHAPADFLTRSPGHRYFGTAVTLLKSHLERPVPG